jgi:nitroimidazol reductase NimA-like FMN-containing flavoprotein (pyridoxamine 5'-phosphate oxidase superfamily)
MQHEKVSFCVIDQDQIVPEEYTTYFRSVIVFGRIHIIDNDDEKRSATSQLAEKYRPGFETERKAEITQGFPQLCVFELEIEHMTGKEAIELMKAKKQSAPTKVSQ